MKQHLKPRRRQPAQSSRVVNKLTPTIRFSKLGDDASGFAPCREFKDNKKVRPTNFQKWVKNFNSLGDPCNHLARFK